MNAQGQVVGTLRTRRPAQGDTVVLNIDPGSSRRSSRPCTTRSWPPTAQRRPQRGPHPDGHRRGRGGPRPPERRGAGPGLVPDLRPETVGRRDLDADYQSSSAICTPPRRRLPANDNAIQGLYTPGSTFKLVTATAALNTGIISADTRTSTTPAPSPCPTAPRRGCTFHDDEAADAGEVNVTQALTESRTTTSSTTWATSSGRPDRRHGNGAPDPIQDTAAAYGLGELTGIDLPGEVAGLGSTARGPDQARARRRTRKPTPTAPGTSGTTSRWPSARAAP